MFAIIEKLVIKTKLRIIETTICELPGSEDLLYRALYDVFFVFVCLCAGNLKKLGTDYDKT